MRVVSIVVVLLLAACVAGCEEQAAQASVTATPVSHSHARSAWMTDPGDAMSIATGLLRRNGQTEGDYIRAAASFNVDRGEWHVVFYPFDPPVGDAEEELLIVVDDHTRRAKCESLE